jgi:hypothetical protein
MKSYDDKEKNVRRFNHYNSKTILELIYLPYLWKILIIYIKEIKVFL